MDHITLNHGSGGRQMHELITDVFAKAFGDHTGNDDSAVFPSRGNIAFTTDSYVVSPLFFPGGNIGALAISGTVNDLCTSGALPAYLSCGLIIEDGFPMSDLKTIIKTMAEYADLAGVRIITGDTKVVERGKADGIFINTAGVGFVPEGRRISSSLAIDGDIIMITGETATHEMALFKARENPPFALDIESDVKPLSREIASLLDKTDLIHSMKDPTRGGLAGVCREISMNSNVQIELEEDAIPVQRQVASACALLGFDPLYMANEGKMVIVGRPEIEASVKSVFPQAAVIGTVKSGSGTFLRTTGGGLRRIGMLETTQLPRIC